MHLPRLKWLFGLVLVLFTAPAQAQGAPDQGRPGGEGTSRSKGTADDSGSAAPEALPPLSESLTGMARAEYEAARILYEDGDYAGALHKLRTSHQLSKDPRLLWNMAAAEKNLRHYSRVLALIEEYLAAGEPYVTPEDRQQAETLVNTVRGFVSEVTLDVRPEGATVTIDGEAVGRAPLAKSLVLDLGKRRLTVTKSGYLPYEVALELEGGQVKALEIELRPEVHEGKLRVVSDPNVTIRVDGKVVGVGMWEGNVPSGTHTVQLEGRGKVPTSTDVALRDGETRILSQSLRDEPAHRVTHKRGLPAWAWITGGVVVVAAASAGTYFALRDPAEPPPPQPGTWATLEF